MNAQLEAIAKDIGEKFGDAETVTIEQIKAYVREAYPDYPESDLETWTLTEAE